MMHILVVDDSKFARSRVKETISTFDIECQIVEAVDGLEALEAFNTGSFSVIMTDIEMPNMDGMTLLKEIRLINDIIPVIIISSIANEQIKQSVKSDKYTNYLKKPMNSNKLEMLLLQIQHRLSKGENI
ncbi:response regulator [Sulfurimonas sp. SAG-AH-194-I05]|nr:response regulator [Sulfurimonas sp. SAG-AH-194-I05]MDF1874524.1 response regulator [Sulfurimonas sp. SAG-AH-194-I05]